jgi:hypothetical protein
LLYAGLFNGAVLILLGVIGWATSIYMANSLDAAVDSDIAELEDAFQGRRGCRIGGISQGTRAANAAGPNVLFARASEWERSRR